MNWKQMRLDAKLTQAEFGARIGYGARQVRSFEIYGAKVPEIVQRAYRALQHG